MKHVFLFFALAQFSAYADYPRISHDGEPGDRFPLTHAPGGSREQFQGWVDEAVADLGSKLPAGLKVKLVDSETWSNYVNHHHFVPLTCEGVPAGFHFDYHWDGSLTPEQRRATVHLPTAEVIETGEFFFWWERCNYFGYDEQTCKDVIRAVISHEGKHYSQWDGIRKAGNLDEQWFDCGHYQCREVEVYNLQIASHELPEDMLLSRIPVLETYKKGCEQSRWAHSFRADLEEMGRNLEGLARLKKAAP